MKRYFYSLIVLQIILFSSLYSQNLVNVGLSTQELKNGIALFNERRYAAAIQSFELSLSYEPLNYAARFRLGLAYLYAGYAQSAIRVWEELVRAGVADNQVLEQLNSLYFRLSKDKEYNYSDPYIFRKYYNGFSDGGHDIVRSSFIIYDSIKDRKFISSTGTGLVIEMDSANTVLQKYGSQFFRKNLLKMPMGIALYNDQVYVADYKKNKIFVFNRDLGGTLAFSFGDHGILSNQISGPMGLLISEDDYLYVVDNGNNRIQKFLPDGTHVQVFGSDYLYRPTDIVGRNDMLYVSDIDANNKGRIVQFDKDGNFIRYFGTNFLVLPRGLFLESNQLYISDASGIMYIYNLDNDSSHAFSANDKKLLYSFDMMKDKDKILWRTDFNSQNIAIYTPLQGIYGNISIDIPQFITDQYPYMYALIRARNKDDSPLTGISSGEIKITEFDQPVKNILVSGTRDARSKMLTSILVDRSHSMDKYFPQLEYYIKSFLSNSTGNDQINITLVDKTVNHSQKMAANIMKTWTFITNYQSQQLYPSTWDIPIYDSITGLLNNLRNRAVIIFTSGEGGKEMFETYGNDIIQTYADQNSIPLYVINFSSSNASFWRDIAEESHGKYLEANKNPQDIVNLYQTIKDSPPLEYLVEYEAYNYADVPGLWVDVNLLLERFGVNGSSLSGYYVPGSRKYPLNITNQFISSNTN